MTKKPSISCASGVPKTTKNIDKKTLEKLTKVIHRAWAHNIPLKDIMYGVRGLTLQSVQDAWDKHR